ncbi:histidine phosphatase family protein [Nocardia sp. 348MFTsu5.1]|uniref:histidine phosphatase family protein n=1 Tax=Nocardia sp. 348MFTsu5.1 TaxID=1172185 RepID=UPI0003A67BA2|nr:histidine phosphatase family protein [Nocardia sp. 348MFTsu5.1]
MGSARRSPIGTGKMSAMGVIYLVRHGQAGVDENGYGSLTELGRRQAHNVGKTLAARAGKVNFTVSGNLARQLETIEEIVAQFPSGGAPEPVVNPGWNEYNLERLAQTHVPPTGITPEATSAQRGFQRNLDGALIDWANSGDSSYTEYRAGVRDAVAQIAEHAGPGQVAIAASSAGTIGAVIADLWGISTDNWPGVSRTMVNGSITKLLVGRSGINVMSVNDHAHADIDDADGERPMVTMR